MPEKILVVDDDIDTLRLVGLMLQRQGYQIVAASNGQQALSMALNERPDLILLDVMMPDMDGYEVTRRLRADPLTSAIPIIMFTAKSQVDDKVTGFDAGADDYLTKPTQPRELFAHIKAVLARGSKARPTVVAPPEPKERGHVIGVMAAKGGLGVTTLALNLGICLRQSTKKSLIIADYRPGEGSMSLDLGFTMPEGFQRLLQRKPKELTVKDVDVELVTHSSGVRLLLSSYNPADVQYIQAGEIFEEITRKLASLADFVVLDLGPGLNPINERVLERCGELILVLEPAPHTVIRTSELMKMLSGRGFGEGRVTVVLYNRNRSELQLSINQVQEQFRHPLSLVFTPAPELAVQASKSNTPMVLQRSDNLTIQQFYKLAELIMKHNRE
jgi:CheY-like chemotaxis protein